MSYIADNFQLTLALSKEAGMVSGVAALFLVFALSSSILNGAFGSSMMRQLISPKFTQWKLELKKTHAKWLTCLDPWGYLTPLLLQTLLDVITVGCTILLIVTAALSKSAYLGCSIFFVGCTFLVGLLAIFAVVGEGFQVMYGNIHRALLLVVVNFGIFVLVQLLSQGNASFSYRAAGALWVGVSVVPLFYLGESKAEAERREGRGHEGDEPTDIDRYPAIPRLIPEKYVKTCTNNAIVAKVLSILPFEFWIWIVSLIPIFIFALQSAFHTSKELDSGVYVLATVIILESLFQLIGNTTSEHMFLVVFNRFLLVCVGKEYWLVGAVVATLVTSSFALNSWIQQAIPAPSSKHRGEIMHKAMEVLTRLDNSLTSSSSTTKAVASSQNEPTTAAVINISQAILDAIKKPSFAILAYSIWIAISLGIGAKKPKALPLNSIYGMNQLEWAGLIWLLWFTAADIFFVYRVIERNGFGHFDFIERIKKHLPGSDGSNSTGGVDTTRRCSCSCLFSFFRSISDAVKDDMDEPHVVGAVILLCWLLVVGSSILASYLTKLWLMIPLITLLPISIGIFYKFAISWEKAGCPMIGDDTVPSSPATSTTATANVESQESDPAAPPAAAPVPPAVSLNLLSSCPRTTKEVFESWQLSLLLFVLAIGTACAPPLTYLMSIYLGLWLLALAMIFLTVCRWRSKLVVDKTFMLLMFTSWLPAFIWAIVCGVQTRYSKSSGGVVAMLLLAVTVVQTSTLCSFIWSDCLMLESDTSGTRLNPGLISPQKFLQTLVFFSCTLLVALFSVFAAYVSTPLGVALLMLLIPFSLRLGVKVGALKENGLWIKFLTDNKVSLVTYANARQGDIIILMIFSILVAGVIGAVSHQSHAFWWASFSWLSLAFCALSYGLYDLMTSPPKVYSAMFYPVYSMNSASTSVEDVSLKSSFILVFLVMLTMWAVWCSIIIVPSESGVVLFVVTIVTAALYVRIVGSSVLHRVVDDHVLAKAKEEALKRIYSSESAESTGASPTREDARPLKDILHAVGNDLREKIRERNDAEEHFFHLVAEHAQIDSELSPVPFLYLFAVMKKSCASKAPEPEKKSGSREGGVAKPRPTVLSVVKSHTDNPMISSDAIRGSNTTRTSDLDIISLDIEARASADSRDSIPTTNLTAASPSDVKFKAFKVILEAHMALRQKVTDLNRYHAHFTLKALQNSENQARIKTKELLGFLKGDVAMKAKDDSGLPIFTQEQVEELKKLTAEELLSKFPYKKLGELLDVYRQYQQDKELARLKEEEKRRKEEIERSAADAAAKAELARIAQDERRKAEIKAQEARLRELKEEAAKDEKKYKELEKLIKEQEVARSRLEREQSDVIRKLQADRDREEAEIARKRLELETLKEQSEQIHSTSAVEAAKLTKQREDLLKKLKSMEDERTRLEAERRAEELRLKKQMEEIVIGVSGAIAKPSAPLTRDPFPVVGRYGVPIGNLEEVIKNAGLVRGQKYRDRDFDIENLEDLLGKGSDVAKNSSSYSKMELLESYAGLISKSKAEGKYEHGFVEPAQSRQVQQGQLGDCYFLSALANVAEKPGLVKKLFPLTAPKGGVNADTWKSAQETSSQSGLFAVRLFFNGEYKTVIVDDTLVGDSKGRNASPLFARGNSSVEHTSIWVMLVEKAYAKLHGTFASIEGGFTNLAMEDLTGGVPGTIDDLTNDMDAKWSQLKILYEGGHLLGAGSTSGSDKDISDEGIVQGHAYSILQVRQVDNHRLLQMRNPWGGDGKTGKSNYRGEWNGAWSDKSSEWEQRYKTLLGWEDKNDGKFWIAFEDFVRVFRCVYLCRIFPIVGGDPSANAAVETDSVRFRMQCLPRGGNKKDERRCQWKKSATDCGTAGGCSNNATYERNPQFVVSCNEDTTITIVLSQTEDVSMGISVSDAKKERNGDKCMGLAVFNCGGKKIVGRGGGFNETARVKSYTYSRDSTLEFKVLANTPYTIVPALFEKDQENTFSLRAYAQCPSDATELSLLPIEEWQGK